MCIRDSSARGASCGECTEGCTVSEQSSSGRACASSFRIDVYKRQVYALCGRDRSCETGGSVSGSSRVRGDFHLSGKTGKPAV